MSRIFRASPVLLFAGALPVLAATMAPDPGTVTCKNLLSMDKVGKITVAMATKDALKSDANVQSMSDEDVLRLALNACSEHPKENVLQAVES